MAFCGKCGASYEEGTKFCPSCGAPTQQQTQQTEQTQQTQGQNDFSAKFQELNNTPDTTANYSREDINQNRFMAILAYLGFLWFIPFFTRKQSPYVQYHCKQAINLLVVDVSYVILSSILSAIIKVDQYYYGYYIGSYTPGWLSLILWLISIPIFVLAIIGIINAAKGKAKELPIIGKFKIIK